MTQAPRQLGLQPLVIGLIVFLLLAVLIKHRSATIEPLAADAPESVFSAGRAFDMLEYLTIEQVPHTVDTPANRVVEERIVELLRDMGYQEEIQDTPVCRDNDNGTARCTRVRNIIASIPGTQADHAILLSAHYDSAESAPGASDAGAAVATLLEVARLLSEAPPPGNPIVFLFNEGEEYGLMGAQAFMEDHPLAQRIKLVLNIEARGTTGQSVMFETGEDSGWLVDVYAQVTPAPSSSSLFYEVYKILPNDTDLTVYKEHGLQGLNFAHAERLVHYHTPLDNLENLDRGSLQHHGDNVWGVLNAIKDLDLEAVESGNLIYTDVMNLFVIRWHQDVNTLIAVVLAVSVFVVLMILVRGGLLRAFQVSLGIGAVLLIVGVAALSSYLAALAATLPGQSGVPWNANPLPMRFAIWLGALGGGLWLARMLVRNAAPIECSAALAIVWSAFTLLSALLSPGASVLFALPAAVTIAGLVLQWWLGRAPAASRGKRGEILTLISVAALSAIGFILMAYVMEIMVTFRMAVAVGVFVGFAGATLLPLLAMRSAASRNFNRLIVALVAGAIIGIGWTAFQAPYTPSLPQHLNIGYVNDAGTDESHVFFSIWEGEVPDALIAALGADVAPANVLPWTSSKPPAATVSASSSTNTEVVVTNRKEDAGATAISLAFDAPAEGFHELRVYVEESSELVRIVAGEESIDYADEPASRNGYHELRCRGRSCARQSMTLHFAGDAPGELMVVTVVEGLPEAYRPLRKARGSLAVPVHWGDKSYYISRHGLQ